MQMEIIITRLFSLKQGWFSSSVSGGVVLVDIVAVLVCDYPDNLLMTLMNMMTGVSLSASIVKVNREHSYKLMLWGLATYGAPQAVWRVWLALSLKYGMWHIQDTTKTLIINSLENEVVVLHGAERDAACQLLRGVIVLCLAAPLNVEGVYLQMTGRCRIGWVIPLGNTVSIVNRWRWLIGGMTEE